MKLNNHLIGLFTIMRLDKTNAWVQIIFVWVYVCMGACVCGTMNLVFILCACRIRQRHKIRWVERQMVQDKWYSNARRDF